MTEPTDEPKKGMPIERQYSEEDKKLLERAQRRGSATDIVGTLVFEHADPVNIDDILNEELALVEWKPASGKFGVFVVLHLFAPKTNRHLSTVTGGQVIVRKVQELTDKKAIPCMVTIIKTKDYYDLT